MDHKVIVSFSLSEIAIKKIDEASILFRSRSRAIDYLIEKHLDRPSIERKVRRILKLQEELRKDLFQEGE